MRPQRENDRNDPTRDRCCRDTSRDQPFGRVWPAPDSEAVHGVLEAPRSRLVTRRRGRDRCQSLLNKGAAFTEEERDVRRKSDDLERYIGLAAEA